MSGSRPADAVSRLREIVARLRAPDGCPWDREQTHLSLRSGLIEEAYETVEAIEHHDDPHLREELGDLLLQVVMHSQIASEENRFTLDDVAAGIAEKLVRRHPHVFGANKLADSEAVLKQWDEIKHAEKGRPESILDHLSGALPALMRAEKVQKRAARIGFDWPTRQEVIEKIREETDEIAASGDDEHALADEIGDLLFTAVNLARKCGLDPELLLHAATSKFIRRFQQLEATVRNEGADLTQLTLAELDAIWDRVKQGEPGQAS